MKENDSMFQQMVQSDLRVEKRLLRRELLILLVVFFLLALRFWLLKR